MAELIRVWVTSRCAGLTLSHLRSGTNCRLKWKQFNLICRLLTLANQAVSGVRYGGELSGRYGWNGFHREQQGSLHADRPHQYESSSKLLDTERWSAISTHRRRVFTPQNIRPKTDVTALKESDAYPAMRRMDTDGRNSSQNGCAVTFVKIGVATRIARYHNIYGPEGTWQGGREKAPAAFVARWLRPN